MSMEKHIPKAETRFDDMAGAVSINFKEGINFEQFASEVAGVDLEKYTPVSLRIFFHKEILVTIYALIKGEYEDHQTKTGKLLVKKFKAEISPIHLIPFIRQADCTLVNGEYEVEDFEVVN